jgi:radical SAM superfamily enzyme YgiQ (UPF0313 family)
MSNVLLVATYELGHQPLHIAAPAAALRDRGHDVHCLDLSLEPWDPVLAEWADHIAFSVPMHTAMRIARDTIATLRAHGATTPVACFGLYAAMADDVADRVIAGETDAALVDWIDGGSDAAIVHLGHGAAASGSPLSARDLLPPLRSYTRLVVQGEERAVGYVEASHGCAHRCRHCPVPVVYDGRIRIVDIDAVVADVAQQVEAGAEHITFGDPDFMNGVHHSLRVVRAVHERFPEITFDCTVKVEHILRHAGAWPELADAGCLFVVSAFESVNDEILARLGKGHTAAEAARAVELLRTHGIEIRPSFLPFTPWTTTDDIRALLDFVADHDLVGNVDPIQYAIRLLLPEGSLLLDHADMTPHLGPYDAAACSYTWTAVDPAVDELQTRIAALVEARLAHGDAIPDVYRAVRAEAGLDPDRVGTIVDAPRLTESWFCCAEPTSTMRQSAM